MKHQGMTTIMIAALALALTGCAARGTDSSSGGGTTNGSGQQPAALLKAIEAGQVKIIDCSHTYSPEMPSISLPPQFGQNPPFELHLISRYDEKGPAWYWNWFKMGEHTGTHVDAPNHWVSGKDNVGVDRMETKTLIVPAVVIDVEQKATVNNDYEVTREDILAWESRHGRVPKNAMIVMNSGWGKRWMDAKRYINLDEKGVPHNPGFGEAAAELLLKEREIAGLAVDSVSTEALALAGGKKPNPYPVHFAAHAAAKYQIEAFANAERLPPAGAILIISPLKIKDGSGAPARILALVP
jgi:kynurenine formamidase